MSDARCDHCEIDLEMMPGWKHLVRNLPSGTVEHVWFGFFFSADTKFAVGVSVCRHPIDAEIANGRPLITWKLKPASSEVCASGAAGTVLHGVAIMLDADPVTGQSKMDRWAAALARDRARPLEKKQQHVEVETKPVPF